MKTYNYLSKNDIANILYESEEDGEFDGAFSEKTFIAGVKLFIKRLRKKGAYIPK